MSETEKKSITELMNKMENYFIVVGSDNLITQSQTLGHSDHSLWIIPLNEGSKF